MLNLAEAPRVGWRATRLAALGEVTHGGGKTLGTGDELVTRPVIAGNAVRLATFASNAQFRFCFLLLRRNRHAVVSRVAELCCASHHAR